MVHYGPRRYGKSSLVAQLLDELEKKGMPCIVFDVMKVPSIDSLSSGFGSDELTEIPDLPQRLLPKTSGR